MTPPTNTCIVILPVKQKAFKEYDTVDPKCKPSSSELPEDLWAYSWHSEVCSGYNVGVALLNLSFERCEK